MTENKRFTRMNTAGWNTDGFLNVMNGLDKKNKKLQKENEQLKSENEKLAVALTVYFENKTKKGLLE